MTGSLFQRTPLDEAFAALTRDLIDADGPRISTMRNYRFAIVQYAPKDEFACRARTQQLAHELQAHGWMVLTLDLHRLLLDRVRAMGDDWVTRVMATERRSFDIAPERGLNYLAGKLRPLIEGPDGVAADVAARIGAFVDAHPEHADRTLALVGRAGALHPFFRSSALLKHIDGRTHNVPVVLLYPGERRGPTGLSFMGTVAPDNDYRPRIYP